VLIPNISVSCDDSKLAAARAEGELDPGAEEMFVQAIARSRRFGKRSDSM